MPRVQIAGLAISVAGIALSIYLTLLHYQGVVPACPVNGHINCDAVLSSRYAVIAGTTLPTSAAGLVWFAVSAVLWARPPGRLLLVWSALGLATVLYLVFIEIVQIGAICLWCTAAHLLVLILFLTALTVWQRERVA
jgi:uncharacterized membrane protein